MRKIALLLLFAIVVFGASATGSWYLRARHAVAAPDAGEEQAAASGHEGASPEEGATNSADAEQALPPPPSDGSLPVAARPRPMSPEEIIRYGMSLKAREEALAARESRLENEYARLELVFADIKSEQREMDGLQDQAKSHVQAAEKVLASAAEERRKLAAEQAEAETKLEDMRKSQTDFAGQERDNIKRMSSMVQAMESTKAATFLKELSNEGQMDMVVQILFNLEEREAAKILGELDNALQVQLAEKIRGLKPAEKKNPKR